MVKSNSLQDSFLKIGEKEFRTSSDELQQLESLIKDLTMRTTVNLNARSHFGFLLKRKWLLMVNIPIQFIIFLTVIIFPVFILLFTVDSLGSNDIDMASSYKELAGAVFLVTLVMLCSIFVYVPCYERGSKMHFLMRRLGISSGKYWIAMLVFDSIIGVLLCLLTFGLVSLLYIKEYSIGVLDWLDMCWRSFVWLITFITQSKSPNLGSKLKAT